jgi:rod shape-determining protein MreB
MATSKTFYIGIDLGTSQSSIVTSTGKRISSKTCVGYPKDIISRKRLNKEYLLGEEAIRNRLSLNMVWPLADGVIQDDESSEEATRLIIQNLIDMTLGERSTDDKVFGAIGVPSQASIQNKKALIKITEDSIDKLLVVTEPFAVAYGCDRFDECLIVDIGAGTTDLCRMYGSVPNEDDQRTLIEAGNFLDKVIMDAIWAKYPDVQLTPKIIQQIKEKHGYVSDSSDPVVVTLNKDGQPGSYDITQILHSSCLKLSDAISQAVQSLVSNFDPDFQELLRNNIIVAGGGSRLIGIDKAIEKSLEHYGGGKATCIQDVEFCGANGCLKMSQEMPEAYWEKI